MKYIKILSILILLLMILTSPEVGAKENLEEQLKQAFREEAEALNLNYNFPIYMNYDIDDFNHDGVLDIGGICDEIGRSYILIVTILEGKPQRLFLCPMDTYANSFGADLTYLAGFEDRIDHDFYYTYSSQSVEVPYEDYIAFRYIDGTFGPTDRIYNDESEGVTTYIDLTNSKTHTRRFALRAHDLPPINTYYLSETTVMPGPKPSLNGFNDAIENYDKWVEIKDDPEMLVYGAKNWTDPTDLSMKMKTRLYGTDLYIYVQVTDDQVIFDETRHLKQDHVELWFDTKTYWQRWGGWGGDRIDFSREGLYQFGFYQQGIETYLPEGGSSAGIEHQIRKTPEGYKVMIRLPLADFLDDPLWDNLAMTLVVSDTDSIDEPKQDTLLATSTFKWGKFYTLGQVQFPQDLVPGLIREAEEEIAKLELEKVEGNPTVQLYPVDPFSGLYLAVRVYELNWWEDIELIHFNRNTKEIERISFYNKEENLVLAPNIYSAQRIKVNGFINNIFEVKDSTHRANGHYYLYELVDDKLELLLKTRAAVSAGGVYSDGTESYSGIRDRYLEPKFRDLNADGVADLILSGVLDVEDENQNLIYYTPVWKKVFLYDPEDSRYIPQQQYDATNRPDFEEFQTGDHGVTDGQPKDELQQPTGSVQLDMTLVPELTKYRELLQEEASLGVNFASQYRLVTLESAKRYDEVALIHLQTGRVMPAPFVVLSGLELDYHADSNLVINNLLLEEADQMRYNWLSTDYYLWEEEEFLPIHSDLWETDFFWN